VLFQLIDRCFARQWLKSLANLNLMSATLYIDITYERAHEDFWSNTLRPALCQSRYLIVVGAPLAAEPHFIAREIDELVESGRDGLARLPAPRIPACGGVHGYIDFLAAIADAEHPEHESSIAWAGGAYDPHAFDPTTAVFDDPPKRWTKASSHGEWR